jgi:hypothetical protein
LTFNWSNYEFLSYFKNSVALNHINEDHTLLRKSSHTHALHELSWLLKNFYLYENLCSLITWLFFICLRIFDKLSDCFLRFRYMCVLNSCWNVWLWFFSKYSVYPLSLWDKKGEYFFIFGPGMYFQTGQVFLIPEWANEEFVSILYGQHFG